MLTIKETWLWCEERILQENCVLPTIQFVGNNENSLVI